MMHTNDPECAFCRIVTGRDRDAREIYRDGEVVAFFPTEPAMLGHTLLIPRDHVPNIWALSPDLACRLALATVSLSNAVRRAIAPDGLNVIQSNGRAASQTVEHLHVHILPRWEGDKIGPIWPRETAYSEGQKDEAWEAIRAECQLLMGDD